MTVESATYIPGLNPSYPTGATSRGEADDHLRLIKSVVKASFPDITGAVTVTHTELNLLTGITKTVGPLLQRFSLSISANNTVLAAKDLVMDGVSLSISSATATLAAIEPKLLAGTSLTEEHALLASSTTVVNGTSRMMLVTLRLNPEVSSNQTKIYLAGNLVGVSHYLGHTQVCLAVAPGESYWYEGSAQDLFTLRGMLV